MHLRVATYNIHRCVGRDGIESPVRIAKLLQEIDADLVALQEVSVAPEHHSANVLEHLEQVTQADAIKGFTLEEKNGFYGNALLSRFEPAKIKRIDISVPNREPRGIIDIELEVDRLKIAVMATHLGLAFSERRQQINNILSELDIKSADIIVLLGDFNEWFFGSRPIRELKQRFGSVPAPATFPAHRPLLRLDRIWVQPATRLISLQTYVTDLSKIASDHLPLVAEIDLSRKQFLGHPTLKP